MSDPLIEYMSKLNEDPQLQARHLESAADAARQFGLPEEDVALIVSGDEKALNKRLMVTDIPIRPMMTFHTPTLPTKPRQ